LVIIRHAKAINAEGDVKDFDRALTDSGKVDAEKMGKLLKEKSITPDLILCSPAKRTKQTAKRIAEQTGYEADKIQYEDVLYPCNGPEITDLLRKCDNSVRVVFVVAHNPGIAGYASYLDHTIDIREVPPCCVVGVKFTVARWTDYPVEERKVFLYQYPTK